MRFRRFLKRALKPFVMVGIVGTLSVSLIVTTPSNAQAFVPAPILPVIAGATTMAMPSVLATSLALHPVGWAIAGIAVVGIGLYASKDYWLPYVTGEMGKSSNGNVTAPEGTANIDPRVTLKTMSNDPGGHGGRIVITGNTTAPTTQGDTYFHVSARLYCNSKADGTGAAQPDTVVAPLSSYSQTGPRSFTIQTFCDSGYVIGAIVGARLATPELTASNAGGGPTNVLRWGNQVTEGQAYDPRGADVAYRVEAECVAPDGTIATATAESLGSEGGIKFPSCEAAGLGHGTGAVKVFTAAPGFAPDEVLWETKRPAADPAQPMCAPTRPGSGCKLGVQLDGRPCVIGEFLCENWAEVRNDPNYSTRLSCQYGPYSVPLDTCNPLERAYEPGGAPATEPNIDGNPATRSDTMPNGQPQPRPDTSTGTGAMPGGAAPGPTPGSSAEQAECFPNGWAMLNPIEWVMKPVGCALDSAFKPKKDLQTRLAGMQGQFANKVPVSWFGVGIGGATAGACPVNWAVEFEGHSYSLICGTEADNIIRNFRPVLGSMLVMAMLWPFIRSLFYAAIPVFKVNPS